MAALALVAPLLAATTKKTSGSPILLIFIAIAAAFYFLIYRPQQRKAKALREQGNAFDVGDEVLTAGGIVGHVIDIDGDRVTLETSVGASFVVLRQYVLRKLEPPVVADEDEDEDDHGDHDHQALGTGLDEDEDDPGDVSATDDHQEDAEAEPSAEPDDPPVTGRAARRRRKAAGSAGPDQGDASDDAGAADGPPTI